MDAIKWIQANVTLRKCTTDVFFYDAMESQSEFSLPLIYVPFDPDDRGHWADRGSAFDFAAVAGPGSVLDYGPGDGWPSLIIAPYVKEVVGVDASLRRVKVCAENARRIGIANATFVHNPPQFTLPFEDGSFDGVTASSSIEQTPDPMATLRELHRVVRPGGRLRMSYEALGRYRGGSEQQAHLGLEMDGSASVIIFDRHIDEEYAAHYKLVFDMPTARLTEVLAPEGSPITYASLQGEPLTELRSNLVEALLCTTRHPSGPTWVRWLTKAGFATVSPTHDGADYARRRFDEIPESDRPRDVSGVDAIIRPIAESAIAVPRDPSEDPMITATK